MGGITVSTAKDSRSYSMSSLKMSISPKMITLTMMTMMTLWPILLTNQQKIELSPSPSPSPPASTPLPIDEVPYNKHLFWIKGVKGNFTTASSLCKSMGAILPPDEGEILHVLESFANIDESGIWFSPRTGVYEEESVHGDLICSEGAECEMSVMLTVGHRNLTMSPEASHNGTYKDPTMWCRSKPDTVLCHKQMKCIRPGNVCDGDNDCDEEEDEKLCTFSGRSNGDITCGQEFKCKDMLMCIPHNKVCDGVIDCFLFGDDEGEVCRRWMVQRVEINGQKNILCFRSDTMPEVVMHPFLKAIVFMVSLMVTLVLVVVIIGWIRNEPVITWSGIVSRMRPSGQEAGERTEGGSSATYQKLDVLTIDLNPNDID